ncbi:MAG: hypothetical protein AB7I13_00060 [Vicinamibacterales bacterium]
MTAAELRDQLEHLRQRAEICRIAHQQRRNHANEIAKLYADQALDDFLAAHPGLA